MQTDSSLTLVSLALQFLLELGVLAALGYWGYATAGSRPLQIVLAVGAPLVAAVIWGIFGSPRAPHHLTGVRRRLLEAAFFGSATVALAAAGQVVPGVLFAAIAAANITLLKRLGHD